MKRKRILTGFFLVILTGSFTFAYLYSPLIRCLMVPWSDFKKVGQGLYVAPDMTEAQIRTLMTEIGDAKSRVAAMYWGCEANPVIIAGDRPRVRGRRAGKYGITQNGTGISHISVAGSYIVLGPRGMNVNVISHELSHCELAQRVGIFKLGKIPTWFNEGLAMQMDYRPRYAETEWIKLTRSGEITLPLEQIDTPREFYNREAVFHYIVAKHEVKEWLFMAKTRGLLELIGKMKEGKDFKESYYAQFR